MFARLPRLKLSSSYSSSQELSVASCLVSQSDPTLRHSGRRSRPLGSDLELKRVPPSAVATPEPPGTLTPEPFQRTPERKTADFADCPTAASGN